MYERMENFITIDKDAALFAFARRGLKPEDVSEELGYSSGFLTQNFTNKKMRSGVVKMLNTLYGIAEVELTTPVSSTNITPFETQKKDTVVYFEEGINYERLYQTIYGAVYEAVKKAWSE